MAELGYHPEFGGSSGDGWGAGEMVVWGPFTMTENGTLTEGHPFVGSANSAVIKIVVYNDNGSNAPGTRFAYFADYTIPDNTNAYRTIATTITGSTTLVSGNKYHIGWDTISGSVASQADSAILSPGGQTRKSSVPSTPPDPFGTPGGTVSGEAGGMYVVYTPGASSPTGSSSLTETVGITSTGIPTRKGASVISEVFGATSSGHSVQAALVFADSVDGSWTDQGGGTNLTAAIDEALANTSDYIRSELTPQDSGCRVKLASIGIPSSTSNHFVRWSIAKDVASGDTINMTVKLYQGGGNSQGAGTLIASFSRNNVSETFTTYSETLSSGQVASISNYADLYLEFFADTA